MKLKELKSGMAVHCQTKEQAKEYCRQLELAGLCDYAICNIPFRKYGSELCYLIDASASGWISYGKYTELEHAKRCGHTVIEFTDLEFGAPEETEQEKTMEKRTRIKDNKALEQLAALHVQHPDYPIIPMVDEGVIYNVEYAQEGCWMGRLGEAGVKKLYSGNQGVHEYVKRPGGNTLYTTLEDSGHSESELEKAEEDTDYARELYRKLPWVECIVVYIDTP